MNLYCLFVSIIVGFVTLIPNMILTKVVPAIRQIYNGVFYAPSNAFEGCQLYLSCFYSCTDFSFI